MSYITKYIREENSIKSENGVLHYCKVTPVFSYEDQPECSVVENSCFLYEDYSAQLKPGDVFYEITLIEIKEEYRRRGEGTHLVKEFFEKCNPQSVVLLAGITQENLYNTLRNDENRSALREYIYTNIVPFWESVGFTDVNHTTFYMKETVPMLWPVSAANEAKRLNEEFKTRTR